MFTILKSFTGAFFKRIEKDFVVDLDLVLVSLAVFEDWIREVEF